MSESVAHSQDPSATASGALIRVRGLVQGVGFRPNVWRLAQALGLAGSVRNDGDGVLIRAWGEPEALAELCRQVCDDAPPLARIDALERSDWDGAGRSDDFVIEHSATTSVHTGVVPDAATCQACLREIQDPGDRRHRYPFTNCTHCGPRLSIVRAIPYDRANTSMSVFPMCPDCEREYRDPSDRRFHAQPNACPVCGPRVWLERADGTPLDPAREGAVDPIAAASRLLAAGRIVALKGIGGFHLACDATDADAVAELRRRKGRYAKPLALMARDLDVIARFAELDDASTALLRAPAAPIVLLPMRPGAGLAPAVAPGQTTIGCMLPYSPLHHLLLADWDRPLVMTSGNRSEEPQCIDNADARARLAGIADALLLHDRDIINRVDDSVTRVMDGAPRLLRRARGFAPAPLTLPAAFAPLPPVLAMGGELKNSICLLKDGQAVLSQHLGDLHDAATAREFEHTIGLYRTLYQHLPAAVAVDAHPGYHASRVGRQLAAEWGIPVVALQHHRAHIAAVLADNARAPGAPPVLGIALDGSGYGDDGSVWGGEWFVGGYTDLRRVARLRQVPLLGGSKAILEPWRVLFAHLDAALGWDAFRRDFGDLPMARALAARPVELLRRMAAGGINAPLTSSCGRLFDAVAAALGICADRIAYEGQAAIELETRCGPLVGVAGYPFAVVDDGAMAVLDPAPMWRALCDDLAGGAQAGLVAMRFHAGLAEAVTGLSADLAAAHDIGTVALSGGVFQNRTLFEALSTRLREVGLSVLSHGRVPSNDGGLALGQAVAGGLCLSESPWHG
ncbi:carbamoyltransferase HypF [Thiohalocapsa sp. ML1]|uniref:carbamoyltransferase HypF n=1 Tax=Thiohalocapsa sp. ML1 TaxID=1431688 RepID=UPI00073220E2|nr:carbamoyltransferase HypF [Thiohalocapsa sp. ML1]